MVGVKKGSCCKVLEKEKYFFRHLSERQNLALYEGRIRTLQSNIQYVTWYLHIVAEMVSKVQRKKEFWMLIRIMSEEKKLCSPI